MKYKDYGFTACLVFFNLFKVKSVGRPLSGQMMILYTPCLLFCDDGFKQGFFVCFSYILRVRHN
ncbi:hypothetical protein [Caudoviricetes sp.]|nr:hypothetical protein [Caudoviricetes sp.]